MGRDFERALYIVFVFFLKYNPTVPPASTSRLLEVPL
jgi:hypothetical protein